jgi:hypothetical protein
MRNMTTGRQASVGHAVRDAVRVTIPNHGSSTDERRSRRGGTAERMSRACATGILPMLPERCLQRTASFELKRESIRDKACRLPVLVQSYSGEALIDSANHKQRRSCTGKPVPPSRSPKRSLVHGHDSATSGRAGELRNTAPKRGWRYKKADPNGVQTT